MRPKIATKNHRCSCGNNHEEGITGGGGGGGAARDGAADDPAGPGPLDLSMAEDPALDGVAILPARRLDLDWSGDGATVEPCERKIHVVGEVAELKRR
jgi:hypothetical protein